MLEDRFENMTREELVNELRGLAFRYEQFRSKTLPALNEISAERDDLRRQVARLESKIDQMAVDFEVIIEIEPEDLNPGDDPMEVLQHLAIEAYERALGRDYYSDEEL